jgi:hypothetical protein
MNAGGIAVAALAIIGGILAGPAWLAVPGAFLASLLLLRAADAPGAV